MACHTSKRRKHGAIPWADSTYSADTESLPHENDDILGETPIFAIQDPFIAGLSRVGSELDQAIVGQSRKRG